MNQNRSSARSRGFGFRFGRKQNRPQGDPANQSPRNSGHPGPQSAPELRPVESRKIVPVPIVDFQVEGNVFGKLIPELQQSLSESGYAQPTPVQAQCIPHLLEGKDLLGSAQTGTGKTAAFTLPLLQYLAGNPNVARPRKPRVLILAPTRELAAQIADSIATYGTHLDISHTVIFGGVGQYSQEKAMNRGVDILVATPGRLLDLMNQGFVQLDAIEAFVLDEADRMLDMGFIHDVRKVIAKLPRKRQSLFFSATISPEIVSLAGSMLKNAERVTIAPKQPTVERIQQKVMFVDKARKVELLIWILEEHAMDKVIVFVQRKHVANQITQKLLAAGVVTGVIHGNKSQSARTAALAEFKNGRVRALVATDIAARGLDVDGITHVINYELPNEPEIYIHRIGRTARAGADGDAVSFCMPSERNQLRDIERIIRKQIPVDRDHPAHSEEAEYATGDAARPAKRGSGGQSGGGRNQGGGGNRNRTGNRRGKSSSSPQLHFAPPILRGLAEKSRFGTGRNNEANGNVENGNIASSKKPSDNRGNRNRFRSKGPRR